MSIEQIKDEIAQALELAKTRFLSEIDDYSNWKLECAWREFDSISIVSKNESYFIYMDSDYLRVKLHNEHIIVEKTPSSTNKFLSFFVKTPKIKSELRTKIENLNIFLKEAYKKEMLQYRLTNIKEYLNK